MGVLVNKYFPNLYLFMDGRTDYLYLWGIGFLTFMFIIFALVIAFLIGLLLVLIIRVWVKANWNLAKRFSESKTEKAKRLKAQEVANKKLAMEEKKQALIEKKQDRKELGYCVGDEAEYIYKGKDHTGNWRRFGQKCKILEIDEIGDIYPKWEDGTDGSIGGEKFIQNSSFKITKKQKLGAK